MDEKWRMFLDSDCTQNAPKEGVEWTPREDDYLRAFYTIGTWHMASDLGRTKADIIARKKHLRIFRNRYA